MNINVCKEVVVASFQLPSHHLPGGAEMMKILRTTSLLSWDLNLVPTTYKAEMMAIALQRSITLQEKKTGKGYSSKGMYYAWTKAGLLLDLINYVE